MSRIVLALLPLLLAVSTVQAGLDIPICPKFTILPDQLHLDGYNNNLIFYAGDPTQNIMAGTPQGPWFLPAGNCMWTVNGTLQCPINIYSNAAYSNQIGTGFLSSPQLNLYEDVGLDDTDFVSGPLVLTTTYPLGYDYTDYVTDTVPRTINWRPLTNLDLFCRLKKEFPVGPGPVVANALTSYDDCEFVLTLWCANGYNSSTDEFDRSQTTTGFDMRVCLNCTNECIPVCPPDYCGPDGCNGTCSCPENKICNPDYTCSDIVIPTCPCEDPAGIIQVSEECFDDLESGGFVQHTAEGSTCISITFVNGPPALFPCTDIVYVPSP